jgi:hypothetical protein
VTGRPRIAQRTVMRFEFDPVVLAQLPETVRLVSRVAPTHSGDGAYAANLLASPMDCPRWMPCNGIRPLRRRCLRFTARIRHSAPYSSLRPSSNPSGGLLRRKWINLISDQRSCSGGMATQTIPCMYLRGKSRSQPRRNSHDYSRFARRCSFRFRHDVSDSRSEPFTKQATTKRISWIGAIATAHSAIFVLKSPSRSAAALDDIAAMTLQAIPTTFYAYAYAAPTTAWRPPP